MKLMMRMRMVKQMKSLFSFFERIIIIPLAKVIISATEKLLKISSNLEKWLMQKTVLLFLSLLLAIGVFIMVDQKLIVFTESSAEIISDLAVDVIYNEEAYVVEGIPETVDLTLIGKRSDLIFAKQASNHQVTVDLTGLTPGTHRVSIEYKQALPSITHSVNPSVATVVIYPKLSEIKPLLVDILNQEALSERFVISNLQVETDTVIVKGAEKDLETVAVVKALVDLNNLTSTDVGEVVLKNNPIVAYNSQGQIVEVEIEPHQVEATMRVESPNKEVPIRVKPVGEVDFGKAIKTIELSENMVEIFGSEDALENINYVEVEIDVENLAEDREFRVDLRTPLGVRAMSLSSVTVNITLDQAVERELSGINIEYRNLEPGYIVQGLSESDVRVVVGLQGVRSVVDDITNEDVRAFLDLAGLEPGEHEVEVKVEGTDVRVNYVSKTRRVSIKIVEG